MERPDEAFIREARSNLRELADGLLAIEGRRDPETVDELFRTAHSLKGACRTAGLADASQLAHALEDLLDALRRSEGEATPELTDEALAAVDDLEETIEAAARGEEPAIDPIATGESLRDALERYRTETEEPAGGGPAEGRNGDTTDETPGRIDDDALSDDVLAALDDASEFDDIDALVAEMDDPDDASLEGWGVLDEGESADADTATDDATDPDHQEADEPESLFESVREDVGGEPANIDALEEDIEEVTFDEFDDDVSIEELVNLDPSADPSERDVSEPTDATPPEADSTSDADESGPVETGSESETNVPGDVVSDDVTSSALPTDAPAVDDGETPSPRAEPPAESPVTDDATADESPSVGDPPDEATSTSADAAPESGQDATDGPDTDGLDIDPDVLPDLDRNTTDDTDDEALNPDVVPDVDLDAVDVTIEADAPTETEMDVELDEEMVAFESRFESAFDQSGSESEADDERSDVFRAAVTTIEASRLDAERFGAADSQEDADASSSGRLPAMNVTVETAERLLNVAEELSMTRQHLENAIEQSADDELEEVVTTLQRTITEYRRTVTDVRLMPLETAIGDVPRTVRDVARSQDKEVDVSIEDADVRLDRGVLDRLQDPLIHLARNAVDHGIEPPDERVSAGKPPEGRIELRAEQTRDQVVIELSDDGRGIDPERVRDAAVELGHISTEEAHDLSEDETYDLLFDAGVSTTESVTDVSGRGVGLDVVGRTVDALDGTVEVESDPGSGTTVRLIVPVSIALTEVLFVGVGDERFGIPLKDVAGVTVAPDGLADQTVIRHEDLTTTTRPRGIDLEDGVPLVELEESLNVDVPSGRDGAEFVWVRSGSGPFAVSCERVVGSREVVLRPYDDLLRDTPGIQGATTLADGQPVNVVDVESLP